MAERSFARNGPCPCGSGRKYKHCCLSQRPAGVSMERYSVRHPQPIYGEGARLHPSHPTNGHPASNRLTQRATFAVRVGVDYTFSEQFGKADVSYAFSAKQKFILEDGNVTWAEFLKPGMRFKLEDGGVATVTKVTPPQVQLPPSDRMYEGGLKEKRILGTIKRTGLIVFDIHLGGGLKVTTTPGHPIYSVTRQAFVPAGILQPGELLRNDRGGTTPVVGLSEHRYGLVELYNVEVEDFHTFFVGTTGNAVMVHNGLEGLCTIVKPLGKEEAAQLPQKVLDRQVKGDHKGRAFGTERQPRMATVEDLNPKIGDVKAGDLETAIVGRKHGSFPEQAEYWAKQSNEELLRFRPDDPISGNINAAGNGFSITGGHHRLFEIMARVKDGRLPADTPIRILFHD